MTKINPDELRRLAEEVFKEDGAIKAFSWEVIGYIDPSTILALLREREVMRNAMDYGNKCLLYLGKHAAHLPDRDYAWETAVKFNEDLKKCDEILGGK